MRGPEQLSETVELEQLGFKPGNDKPQEECAVVGVYSENSASPLVIDSLKAQQHRGQDGAGVASVVETDEGEQIRVDKGLGTVDSIFSQDFAAPARIASGHVRYATDGQKGQIEAQQPFHIKDGDKVDFTVGHNGHFTNSKDIAREYNVDSAGTDTRIFAEILGQSVEKTGDMEASLQEVLPQMAGAFSLSIMEKDRLLAVRDGVRPLVYGEHDAGVMFASEVRGLEKAGADFKGEVKPGSYLVIENGEIREESWGLGQGSCVFELVYLSKPENIINGENVKDFRIKAGEMLAHDAPSDADVVVPVLGSGRYYGEGYASVSGQRYAEALKTRRDLRSFIEPTQEKRELAVEQKFEVESSEIENESVVLVDDSIVRGTTMAKIIDMVRRGGASEVHVRVPCPPFANTCNYGVNVQDQEELLSYNRSVDEMCREIGADSLAFLSVERLKEATGPFVGATACTGCFDGRYPNAISDSLDIKTGKVPTFA